MLTEEEVRYYETQRERIDRARKAGYATAGMSEQERLNYVFKKAQAEAKERRKERILAYPSAEPDTVFRHSVQRNEEMRLAREHEMDRLGKELATRVIEAQEKRKGMREQGRDVAEMNKNATIGAAELQMESAEKIAGINTASAEKIAGINAQSAEKTSKDKGDVAIEVAKISAEGTRQAEEVKAAAMARSEYAQSLMRQRMVDEKTAWQYMGKIMQEAQKLMNSTRRNGRPTMSLEEAIERVKGRMPEPGKRREDYTY